MSAFRCHACGTPWESLARRPGRTEACVKCGADLHCCLNCRFYDRSAPNECREPNADRVLDKGKANFCDYFDFTQRQEQAQPGPDPGEARQRFEDLFKN